MNAPTLLALARHRGTEISNPFPSRGPAMDAFCRGIRLARAGGRFAPCDQRDAAGGTLVPHPRLAGGAGSDSAGRSRPPLRACQRFLGIGSGNLAICSPTSICWRPAGWSTCSSRGLANEAARLLDCRLCRSSSAPTAPSPSAAAHGRPQCRAAERGGFNSRTASILLSR